MQSMTAVSYTHLTGMRVGEMVLLDREDIDFNERECVVFGKGDKERIIYFDARTKIHLQNYLNSRKDDNPALFVSLQSPVSYTHLSAYGCPYVQENCDVQKPSDNIIIYGHHMNDGSMSVSYTHLDVYKRQS